MFRTLRSAQLSKIQARACSGGYSGRQQSDEMHTGQPITSGLYRKRWRPDRRIVEHTNCGICPRFGGKGFLKSPFSHWRRISSACRWRSRGAISRLIKGSFQTNCELIACLQALCRWAKENNNNNSNCGGNQQCRWPTHHAVDLCGPLPHASITTHGDWTSSF